MAYGDGMRHRFWRWSFRPLRRAGMLAVIALMLSGLGPGAARAMDGPIAFERGELAIVTAGGARHRFTVEIARTKAQHARGLMYREELARDHGMLFIYDSVRHASMWMKNTYIPLDMLFIAQSGRIVRIAERTVPQSTTPIPSGQPVRGVLELKGGTAERLDLETGDRVRHDAFGARADTASGS